MSRNDTIQQALRDIVGAMSYTGGYVPAHAERCAAHFQIGKTYLYHNDRNPAALPLE